jgi:sugar phosphate isomerase/epimerase
MRLGFSPVTGQMLDLDASFALAHELGLEFVELSGDLFEIAPALQDPDRVRELCRATGVDVTVHLSYVDLNLASLVPAARRTSVERIQDGLEYADRVGAICGVLHSGLHYLRHPQVDPLVAEALDASLRALRGSRVPIVLENLVLTDDDFVRGPGELRDLTRTHELRNCVDFGHAHIEATRTGSVTIDDYLIALGEDVIHLHLHSNRGARDEHLPTDAGTIDYGAFRDYLVSFEGTACLEILSGEGGVRSSVAHLRALLGSAA